MAKTYDELVNKIGNVAVREIVSKQFPGNITAAKVEGRVSIIMNEINEKIDNISCYISRLSGQVGEVNKRLGKIEKRLDSICDELDIEIDEE